VSPIEKHANERYTAAASACGRCSRAKLSPRSRRAPRGRQSAAILTHPAKRATPIPTGSSAGRPARRRLCAYRNGPQARSGTSRLSGDLAGPRGCAKRASFTDGRLRARLTCAGRKLCVELTRLCCAQRRRVNPKLDSLSRRLATLDCVVPPVPFLPGTAPTPHCEPPVQGASTSPAVPTATAAQPQ
jgi:hypothetical protein